MRSFKTLSLSLLYIMLGFSAVAEESLQCSLEQSSGPCRAYFIRYWYNEATNACEQFVWGGCRGNANNFQSLADCESACKK